MRYALDSRGCRDFSVSSRRAWLLTNGIGGYATGTASGANMRRFHGHLVAATKPPGGAVLLLSAIEAFAEVAGTQYGASTNQYAGKLYPQGFSRLESFAISGHAEWVFSIGRQRLRKRIGMHQGSNAVTIEYANLGDVQMRLTLRPLVAHKIPEKTFSVSETYPDDLKVLEDRFVVEHEGVQLVMTHPGAVRTPSTGWYYRFEFPRETERGRLEHDDLFCPVELVYQLEPGTSAVLVASEGGPVGPIQFSEEEENAPSPGREMMLREAVGKFVITADGGTDLVVGYPTAPVSGREVMLAVPGVFAASGRTAEARTVLRRWAGLMRKGLIPNRPGLKRAEAFDSVDVTLWFANALYETLAAEWDKQFAEEAAGWLAKMVANHRKGTHHGIRVDPDDGLLTQGEAGLQLTWMDVRLRDWLVTPRHGKPIDVNGLWVNALRVAAWIDERLGRKPGRYAAMADRAAESMESKFWRPSLGYYLDTADPDDGSLRPNQVVAMGLPFAPLGGESAQEALWVVEDRLLTPFGLRTLSKDSSSYRGRYLAPMDEPDGALHQGCAWPWLLGPYVGALLRLSGDVEKARSVLERCEEWMESYGMGGIAQFYDGDEPFREGGSPWHAWSAGEVLRAWKMVESYKGPHS